jgi:hypothetical protein
MMDAYNDCFYALRQPRLCQAFDVGSISLGYFRSVEIRHEVVTEQIEM